MEIDILGDVSKRQEMRNGVGVPGVVESEKKIPLKPGDEGFVGEELGDIGGDVSGLGKVRNDVIERDIIGDGNKVIQMWRSGEQYGITIGGKFHEVDQEIWNLFYNAVGMNRALKKDIVELQRKIKVYSYSQ